MADYYIGMCVTVPVFKEDLQNGTTVEDVKKVCWELYQGPIVRCVENADEEGLMAASKLSFKDTMEISVAGNADRLLLISRFDNLGKGASGAALQCMNIAMGIDPTTGLAI